MPDQRAGHHRARLRCVLRGHRPERAVLEAAAPQPADAPGFRTAFYSFVPYRVSRCEVCGDFVDVSNERVGPDGAST